MKYNLNSTFSTLLLMIMLVSNTYAQTDQKLYDNVAASVQKNFNAKQPEKIYQMTSDSFRTKMTHEQFAAGMGKFQAKVGNWNTLAFKKSELNGFDYIAGFENSTELFSLKIDEEGKISRLNFAAIPVVIEEKKYWVQSDNLLKDSTDRWVEKSVRTYIQKGNTSGLLLAIIDKGKIRKYSYGTIKKDIKKLPDAANTIFEIGSVTKTFTSLLLAQEVINGQMKLDDPINQYLPDSIPFLGFNEQPITLKQLANHTSGFPRLPQNIFNGKVNPQDPYKHYIVDSLYGFLMHYKPTKPSGNTFSYSNYGAGLLGTLLERKNKSSFEQLILNRICVPLKMSHTRITLSAALQKNLAQGYNENGQETAPWDLASLKGSGAIRSSLNDMVVYTQAQMGMDNSIKKAIELSHKLTFSGAQQHMALAWSINTIGKNTYFHHAGGTGGFRSFVGFDQTKQQGIVILSNAADDVAAIGESFLKMR